MNDDIFWRAFHSQSLSKTDWTHAAHLRLAWLTLDRQPGQALQSIRQGIQHLNQSHGNQVGYHETITQAYFLLIADHRARNPTDSFDQFAAARPELFERGCAALLRFYRRETLYSDVARAQFVTPDVRPLPGGPAVD